MRANPETNPMRPVTAMGVPMKQFGPIQVIDWAAVQDPSRRAEFGITRPMADEPAEPVDENWRIPVIDDATLDRFVSRLQPNIREAINSYFDRQKEISEQRQEKDQQFRDAIANAAEALATAAVTETPGGLARAGRATLRVLRDEINLPLPTEAEIDRSLRAQRRLITEQVVEPLDDLWEQAVWPAAQNAQVVANYAARRGMGTIPMIYARAAADFAGRNLLSFLNRPSTEKQAAQEAGVAPLFTEELTAEQVSQLGPVGANLQDIRNRLAEAGFTPENVDRDARLYQEFMRNVRTFKDREAQDLGERITFPSVPLGLEGFTEPVIDARGNLQGYRLQSRHYDPMASTLMNLARPGAYTPQEVRQRLESDPSLLEASRELVGRTGQYLTPDRILDQASIIPTLQNMPIPELASLKQHMFDHGYYGSDNPDVMGALSYRNTNQATIDAFTTMVRFAQENGYSYEGWREKIAAEGGWFGAAPTQRQAPLIRLTSKDDIRTVANRVAQQTIGYQLREDELEQFAAAYQNMERSAGLRMAGGGAVEMPPDIGVAAEQMIRDTRTAEAEAFAVGNTIDILRGIMTGGGR